MVKRAKKNIAKKYTAEKLGLERRRIAANLLITGVDDKDMWDAKFQIAFKKAMEDALGVHDTDVVLLAIGGYSLASNVSSVVLLEAEADSPFDEQQLEGAETPMQLLEEYSKEKNAANAQTLLDFVVNTDVSNAESTKSTMAAVLGNGATSGFDTALATEAKNQGHTITPNAVLASPLTMEYVVPENLLENPPAPPPEPENDNWDPVLVAFLWVLLAIGLSVISAYLIYLSIEKGRELYADYLDSIPAEDPMKPMKQADLLREELTQIQQAAAYQAEKFQMGQLRRTPAVAAQPLRQEMNGTIQHARVLHDRLRNEGEGQLETEAGELAMMAQELQKLLDQPDAGPQPPDEAERDLNSAMQSGDHAILKQAVQASQQAVTNGRITEPASLRNAAKVLTDMDRAAAHQYSGPKGTRAVEDFFRGRKSLDTDADYHRKNSNLVRATQ